MSPARLSQARGDLVRVGLIAYERPLYHVLALDGPRRLDAREPAEAEMGVRSGRLRAAWERTPRSPSQAKARCMVSQFCRSS